jgi:glycosyltransferase involved in cell wall biosynthesis
MQVHKGGGHVVVQRPRRVRVYLMTFRRPILLRRAIGSLLQQTFSDWICELHNDDPTDDSCAELLEEIRDDRIVLFRHAQNLGATEAFNLCWRPIDNEFMSILEDDNWWEPEFLDEMIAFMDAHLDVDVIWSNMRLWREHAENKWVAEGRIWQEEGNGRFQLFHETVPRQLMEPLYSNGASLVRARGPHMVPHPSITPFFMMEALRERRFRRPIALCRRPLANFALTTTSAREENIVEKVGGLALLVRSHLKQNDVSRDFIRAAWKHDWQAGRCSLRAIVIGAVLSGRGVFVIGSILGKELFMTVLWFLIHPFLFVRMVRYAVNDRQLASFMENSEAEAAECPGFTDSIQKHCGYRRGRSRERGR